MSKPRATAQHLKLTGQDKLKPAKYKDYNMTDGILVQGGTEIQPPKDISRRAKKLWNSLVPDLITMKTLSTTDFAQLEQLIRVYDELIKVQDLIREFDETHSMLEDPDTFIKKRKMLNTMFTGTQSAFTSLAGHFGMTPVDRTKLPITPEDEDKSSDPLDILLEVR